MPSLAPAFERNRHAPGLLEEHPIEQRSPATVMQEHGVDSQQVNKAIDLTVVARVQCVLCCRVGIYISSLKVDVGA